jgi:L-gulono-1,4-lactone dehydrogenase
MEYLTPRSEEELALIVQEQRKVKVIGSGLSWSGAQMVDSEGSLVSLKHLTGIRSIEDPDSNGNSLVHVGAGMVIRDLVEQLSLQKLSLVNLGATASQTIVGAISTGTHGTGTQLGAMATQVIKMRIMDSNGKMHEVSADSEDTQDRELFAAARVGVGLIGIITEVTLLAVPLWKMKRTITDTSLDRLLVDLPNLLGKYDRLQWSFVPYSDNATLILRENVPDDQENYPSGVDGGCWSETQPTTPICIDQSYKTLTDSKHHFDTRDLYTEMEMFIRSEDVISAIQDYIAWMETPYVKERHNASNYISVMVRCVAGDDIYLSPMYGRDTAVISVIVSGDQSHTGNAEEFEMFSKGLEYIAQTKYQGRPHWGKVSYLRCEYTKQVYEKYDTYESVRRRMDASGKFTNEYTEQRIGC